MHRATVVWCSVALLLGAVSLARADPPATGGGTAAGSSSQAQGGFFSSLKQAFNEDVDREVVWGHFDVGSPPDTHRFYCLMDPKTGKREPFGVAGETFVRRDGTTGLRRPAVSPASCAEAEQKGTLVTSDYVVKSAAGGSKSAAAPAQKTAAVAAAPPPSGAPTSTTASMAAAAPVPIDAPAAAGAPVPAAAVAPTASGNDHAEDQALIRKAESDWGESEVTRDTRVLERLLSDDFVGVDIDGTRYSKSDALQEYRATPSNYVANHLSEVEIRFYGHVAVAQGADSWEKKDGTAGKHVWTDTWVQRDGKWQVVAAEDLVPPARGFRHP